LVAVPGLSGQRRPEVRHRSLTGRTAATGAAAQRRRRQKSKAPQCSEHGCETGGGRMKPALSRGVCRF
jgi:hypothetical protein